MKRVLLSLKMPILLGVLTSAACSGGDSGAPSGPPKIVAIMPQQPSYPVGQTIGIKTESDCSDCTVLFEEKEVSLAGYYTLTLPVDEGTPKTEELETTVGPGVVLPDVVTGCPSNNKIESGCVVFVRVVQKGLKSNQRAVLVVPAGTEEGSAVEGPPPPGPQLTTPTPAEMITAETATEPTTTAPQQATPPLKGDKKEEPEKPKLRPSLKPGNDPGEKTKEPADSERPGSLLTDSGGRQPASSATGGDRTPATTAGGATDGTPPSVRQPPPAGEQCPRRRNVDTDIDGDGEVADWERDLDADGVLDAVEMDRNRNGIVEDDERCANPECFGHGDCPERLVCLENFCMRLPPGMSAPPPMPPSSASPCHLDLQVEKSDETRPGLVNVVWSAEGSCSNLHLVAPFNRKGGDSGCGPIVEEGRHRHLAVDREGSEIDEGSDLYEEYRPYLTGTLVDLEAEGDSESLRDRAVRRPGASDEAEKISKEAEKKKISPPPPPRCRIDLSGIGEMRGEFYTRFYTRQNAILFRAHDGAGNAVAHDAVVSAEGPQILSSHVTLHNRPENFNRVTVTVDYENASGAPTVSGCGNPETTYTQGAPGDGDLSGDGGAMIDCDLDLGPSISQTLRISVPGVGVANGVEEFAISCTSPTVSLAPATSPKTMTAKSDGSGLELEGTASRLCSVFRKNDGGTFELNPLPGYPMRGPWVKDMEIRVFGPEAPLDRICGDRTGDQSRCVQSVTEEGKASIKGVLPQNEQYYHYRLRVYDFDESTYQQEIVLAPLPFLEVENGGMGTWENGRVHWRYTARNCRQLELYCEELRPASCRHPVTHEVITRFCSPGYTCDELGSCYPLEPTRVIRGPQAEGRIEVDAAPWISCDLFCLSPDPSLDDAGVNLYWSEYY